MVNYRAETRFVRKHSFSQKPHFRFLRKCDEKIQHEITHIAIMYNFFTENVFHVTLAATHDDTFLVDLDPADSLDLGKKF